MRAYACPPAYAPMHEITLSMSVVAAEIQEVRSRDFVEIGVSSKYLE